MLLQWTQPHDGIITLCYRWKSCICFSQCTVSFSRVEAISPPSGVSWAHAPIYSACCWFIAVAANVLLRFLAFPVRSGLCRNSGQKAIWCASQSSSPVGSLAWVWCDSQVVQRPRLCSQAQLCLLSHAWLSSGIVRRLPAVSSGGFNSCFLTPDLSLLRRFTLARSHSPFEMGLLRQMYGREESLSFSGLYLIQGEMTHSQLWLRPTRQASDLSQVRGVVDCGKCNCHYGGHKLWVKVLSHRDWKDKPGDSGYLLIFLLREQRGDFWFNKRGHQRRWR